MTVPPSWPNYLQKALLSIIGTLEVKILRRKKKKEEGRILTYEFSMETSIQSITVFNGEQWDISNIYFAGYEYFGEQNTTLKLPYSPFYFPPKIHKLPNNYYFI